MACEAGVHLLYHATLCGVKKNGKKLESVTVATKAGNIELCADYFIDATGDADLSVAAGVKTRLGRSQDSLCQPMTLCFRVGNVDVDGFYAEREKWQSLYAKLLAEGKLRNPRENILVFRTIQKGVLHFNSTRIVKKNPTDPFDVTEAEIEAREQAIELFLLLKHNIEAMKDAELLSTAAEMAAAAPAKPPPATIISYFFMIFPPKAPPFSEFFKDGIFICIQYTARKADFLPKMFENT